MVYLVRAFEDGEQYDYMYGNLKHAKEHYDMEKTAEIWLCENDKEALIIKK